MKNRYKRNAYYLDGTVLLCGHKDKMGFHPGAGLACSFSLQKVNKKTIGKTIFYKISDVLSLHKDIELAGGSIVMSIDDGMALTKIMYKIGDLDGTYTTKNLVKNGDVTSVIEECMKSIGITRMYKTTIKYVLTSENSKGLLQKSSENIISHKLVIQ